MNIKEIFIRLRLKPTYEDLTYVANRATSAVLSTEKGGKLSEIIKIIFPDGYGESTLVNRLSSFIRDVSEGKSRKRQAQIFRKGMLTVIDNSALNNFIFGNEIREKIWLIHHFADANLDTDQQKQAFRFEWALDNIMDAVIKVIYRLQYDGTLNSYAFIDLYEALCVTYGEIVLNTSIVNEEEISGYPIGRAYGEFVSGEIQESAKSLKDRCLQAIIVGDYKTINTIRLEAVEFAKVYKDVTDNKVKPFSVEY